MSAYLQSQIEEYELISLDTISDYSSSDVSKEILPLLYNRTIIAHGLKTDWQKGRDCLLLYYFYATSQIKIGKGSSADHYIRRYDIKELASKYLEDMGLDIEFESHKFILWHCEQLIKLKLTKEIVRNAVSKIKQAVKNGTVDYEGVAGLAMYYHSTMESFQGCIESCKLFLTSNRLEEASIAAKGAIQSEPDHWEGHYLLGQIYNMKGMYENTCKAYSMALTLKGPEKELLLAIAKCNIQLGFLTEAKRNLEKAMLVANSDPNILHQLGMLYAIMNQTDKALIIYKKLKPIDSELAAELFINIYQ